MVCWNGSWVQVLGPGIQDVDNNTTRFLFVSATLDVRDDDVMEKTSLTCCLGERAGALHKALSVFPTPANHSILKSFKAGETT